MSVRAAQICLLSMVRRLQALCQTANCCPELIHPLNHAMMMILYIERFRHFEYQP